MTLQRMLIMRDTLAGRLFVRLENFVFNKDPRFDNENLWHIYYDLLEHNRLSHPGLSGIQLRLPSANLNYNKRLETLIDKLYCKFLPSSMGNDNLLLVLQTLVNLLKNFPVLTVSSLSARRLKLMVFLFITKADVSIISSFQARKILELMHFVQTKSPIQLIDACQADTLIRMLPERHPHFKRLKSKI